MPNAHAIGRRAAGGGHADLKAYICARVFDAMIAAGSGHAGLKAADSPAPGTKRRVRKSYLFRAPAPALPEYCGKLMGKIRTDTYVNRGGLQCEGP